MLAACGGGSEAGNSSFGSFDQKNVGSAFSKDPAPDIQCSVVLYGDSIMRGEPLVQEGPQRRIQRARPSWNVELRAVAGQTGYEGAQLAMSDPRPTPAVVVLQWGVNDATHRIRDFSLMRALIDKVREEGSRPLLTGPSPTTNDIPSWLTVNTMLYAVAQDSGTPWANWGAEPLPTLDGIHPTQASSDKLVDKLIDVLDAECGAISRS
ncbi:hypothetical protein VAR608DRAFT_5880 [Variovorax sp. HW608]|nr:hypothetical protein VAR608DRAFT_5880 [Variovorax sp. HW608]